MASRKRRHGAGRRGHMIDALNRTLRKLPSWVVYVLGALPPLWFLYLGLTGGLGPEPIRELEHRLGESALQMLIAVLCITPLRNRLGLNLIRFRRAVGLVAFSYVALHLAVWLFLDVGIWSQIWADILKRPYITIGMVAFVLMLPLAITSNNASLRKLGAAAWRKLHRLTYPVVLLGALHFVMVVKGWQVEPFVYLGIVVVLLLLRVKIPLPGRLAR